MVKQALQLRIMNLSLKMIKVNKIKENVLNAQIRTLLFLFFVFHFYNKLVQTSRRGLCRTPVRSVLFGRPSMKVAINSRAEISRRRETVFGDVSASSIDFKKVEKCFRFLRPHFSFKDCLTFFAE